MENYLQDPTEVPDHPSVVPDHPSVVPDEILIDFVLVKRGEDLVSKQVAISQTLFQKSPKYAVSQIMSQIGARFLPEEQLFLELAICTHSGIIRTNNLNQIYVYLIITDTVTEADGEETVTLCTPMIFLKKPCGSMNEQFRNFSGYLMNRILKLGSRFKLRLSMVYEAIQKYGDSLWFEEVKEDSNIGEGCSICMTEYAVRSQAIRLPCHHLFCARCGLLWLMRNGSCPLCRCNLVPKPPALLR